MHIAHLHITQINAQLHISGQEEVCKILQDLQKFVKFCKTCKIFLQKFRQKFWQTLKFSRIFLEFFGIFKKMFGIFCYRAKNSILQILNFPKFGNIFKLWKIIWKFSRGVRTSRARRGGRRRANSHHFCKNADFDDERWCVTHDGQTRFHDFHRARSAPPLGTTISKSLKKLQKISRKSRNPKKS